MTKGKFIKNMETGKIELHFDKADYQALSADQKRQIKSAYLWSRYAGAWVSRSTKNHYRAMQVIKALGLEDGGKTGERLSYEEELQRKSEKAEARAERMEAHADNAAKRAENLQAGFNNCRQDWSWVTQPNINSSSGRAFTNKRNKIIARYEKGFDEYRKSEYFQNRAKTARETASQAQLENPVYLHNRIQEGKAIVEKLKENIETIENKIHKIQNGEILKNWKDEIIKIENLEAALTENLENMEYEIDKLAFLENKFEETGGDTFSKENIKKGYIVEINGGPCEVLSAGPVNVKYKILEGGAKGFVLSGPYPIITKIIEAKETKKPETENLYNKGDILCAHRPADKSIYRAYQVIKTTKTGVRIREITVKDGKPVKDDFKAFDAVFRKIVKSPYRDFVGVYMGDWALYPYEEEEKEVAGAI